MVRARSKGSEIVHVFAAKSQAAKKKWCSEMQIQIQVQRDRKSGPPATLPRGGTMLALPPTAGAPRGSSPSTSRSTTPLPAAPSPAVGKPYEQWVVGGGAGAAPALDSVVANVSDESWFAGRMPRSKADRILESAPNGSYLLRESDSRPVCEESRNADK